MEEKLTSEAASGFPTEPNVYTIKGKVFVVEPIFRTDDSETLGDVLLRLIKSEFSE